MSPDHGIFADGNLICPPTGQRRHHPPASRMDHGGLFPYRTTESHAILLAEGLPAESYLDTGNRAFFADAAETIVLHPDLTTKAGNPAREAGSCAPFDGMRTRCARSGKGSPRAQPGLAAQCRCVTPRTTRT